MINPEDTEWLLLKIEALNSPHRPATYQNIWGGSYDVWSCEQDRIDAIEIPRARMKAAQDEGLIESSFVDRGRYKFTVWGLTPKGEERLKEVRCSDG